MKPPRSSASPAADAAVARAAAEWLGRRDGGLSGAEEAEFAAWLEADPRHRAAFQRLEEASSALDQLAAFRPASGGEPDPDLRLLPSRRSVVTRIWIPVTLAAAAALAFAFVGGWGGAAGDAIHAERIATDIGGLRRVTLPDGTLVDLNTASVLEVAYSRAERRIALVRGEAHFSVARDTARPFVVAAGGVSVQAVGTAFNVRLRPDNVDVLVTEGRVRLGDTRRGTPLLPAAAGGSEPPELVAGQRAVIPAAALAGGSAAARVVVTTVAEPDISRLVAWQAGRLEFEPTPLRNVLAEFNRYNVHQLVPGDAEVGDIVVGGSFAAGDYETLVRLLEANFGVAVVREPQRTTLRLRR